jgi:hypothetical protein
MRASYHVTATADAVPSRVWSLLLDARTWPHWGTVDALVTERSHRLSPNGRDGVGAVRAFRTGRLVTSERIVDLRPYRYFTYQGEQNPFLRDYRAEILLSATPAGRTTITWRGSYQVAFGLHLVLVPTLRRTMQRMADGLARAAGRPDYISNGGGRP